jgi:serine-type D-Ala-D-Ala carboxypeptidase (penicillin-binding protein 5/6)
MGHTPILPQSAPTVRRKMINSLPQRILGRWALLVLLAGAISAAVAAPNPKSSSSGGAFETGASSAILIDAQAGSVLYEKGADDSAPPGGLTKLMTTEVVLNLIKQGQLKPSDEFIVSEKAWRRGGAPSRTSSMFVPIHSRVTVDELLQGVIIQSANDASIALAEGVAGNEDAFAEMMTKRARELGLIKSTFGNSNGTSDPRQVVTVRELAKLARHIILTYPDYYRRYSEREYTFNKIKQPNRNPLLAMNIGADGLQTGFSRDAGAGLVGSAVQNGQRLIVVVHGLRTDKESGEEAKRLLEWGFHNFQSGVMFEEGQVITDAKVYGGEHGSVPLVTGETVRLMVARNTRERIVARVTYSGPVRAPVEKGQQIGTLKLWRNDSIVLEVPLRAERDVAIGALPRRAWDAATELFIGLFRAGIQRL